MPGVAFFVCGTPSNSRGFELVELGPGKLPGSPETYLDKVPGETAEFHRIESVLIDGERYVQYSRVLRINPNDAAANRGAYIAVGCLIRQRLALHAVSNCVDVVSELYGRVCSGLTSDRSFPAGFKLAHFTHDGSSLEERTAHQCSPLLVADVVLQALNGEGPIDWAKTREVLLAPGEMIAGDVDRYQLYSRQGLLGSLASIDRDRAQLQQSVQQMTTAAEALVDLQHEWAALEGAAERLLTKGQALKRLTSQMDSGVKRDLALGAAPDRYARNEVRQVVAPGPVPYVREYHEGASAFRAGTQLGRAGYAAAYRRSNAARQDHRRRRSGWSRALALFVAGSVLAAIAFVASQWLGVPESGVEPAPSQALTDPQPHDGEQAPPQPEHDVAKERAALDAPPPEDQ